MSLIVLSEPKSRTARNAGGLETGTWFMDPDGNLMAVLIDDRTDEKRVASLGGHGTPFIARQPVRHFAVGKVVGTGTVLQVVGPVPLGGQENGR